jgi:Fe-S cluster assembly protein SufD
MMAEHTAPYLEAFAPKTGEPRWLAENRQAALAHFDTLGFPTRREEAWRFTDLRPLQRAAFTPQVGNAKADPAPWRLAGASHRIVIVNGGFAPDLSEIGALPAGAWLASTARTLAERPALFEAAFEASDTGGKQPFASLNAAFFADGFVLALEDGVMLDRPVEIIHLADAKDRPSFHLRSLVRLGKGSRAQLIETFAGKGEYWTNEVAALRLAPEAALLHIRFQDEAADAIHFALTRAELDRAARYEGFVLNLGARLSRQDVLVKLAGEGAHCGIDGASLLCGEQEAAIATFIEHAAPGGTTRELIKCVADDRAHGIFLGRIAVRPDAQRTDAHQLSRNLLLSQRAAIDTKPELEILADDVKCSHGATVGDLDEETLFYLRSRGIPLIEARQVLIEAFAADALDRIADPALRAHLTGHLGRWLGQRRTP